MLKIVYNVAMKGYILGLFMVGAMITPAFLHAETVMRSGGDISVAPDQVVDGNYYVSAFAGKTTMSGTVNRDMIALGSSITINGEVKEDLHIAGGNVQVHGPVGGDVRILGGEVTIAEKVGGDIVVVGGRLTVLPTAEVDGDVFFFGGVAEVEGTVAGSVYGSAEQLKVNATVAKNVDIKTNTGLELGERANIAGSVRYQSPVELTRNQSAVVTGEVVHNAEAKPGARAHARTLLVPFLVLLFTTLALYLIFRRELSNVVEQTYTSYALTTFVGVGIFVLGPLFSVILFVTVLGSVVGLMCFLSVLVLVIAGLACAPIFAGALWAKLFGRGYEVSLTTIIIGATTLYGLLFIPPIGIPVFICFMALAVGGIARSLYHAIA